jgi:hypothetical protein
LGEQAGGENWAARAEREEKLAGPRWGRWSGPLLDVGLRGEKKKSSGQLLLGLKEKEKERGNWAGPKERREEEKRVWVFFSNSFSNFANFTQT